MWSIGCLNVIFDSFGRRKTSTISNSILHEFSSNILYNEPANEDDQVLEERFTFKEALPQICASIAATSFHVMLGVTFAATSTLLPQVLADTNPFPVMKYEASWIASVFVLSVPIASMCSGYFMERIGRLNTIKLSVIPAIASCAVIALATNVYMLIGGRCLMGIATAFGINPAVVYITETTSSDYRGALVSAGPTLSSFGMMLGYLFGALLPWDTVSWVNITFCAIPILLITIFRIPESPAWLLTRKNNEDGCRKALEWIARNKTISSKNKFIEERVETLKKSTKHRGTGSESGFLQKLSGLNKPTGYRPLIVLILVFTFQQYCGVYITTFFAVQFFEGAGSAMDPFYASVLIGLLRFIMSMVTTVLLKHLRRRVMYLISCTGMAAMMAVSGYFTMRVVETGESSMIPVVCILTYVAFSMIGLLSLPWTMAAEVFPNEIRAIGHGLVVGGAHIVMFISIQFFYDMVDYFGGYSRVQWFFAIMSVLATVFIYFFLPETHDKDLAEIEEYFANNLIYPGKRKKNPKVVKSPIVKPLLKEPKPINAKTLEALEEYDTLLHREDMKHPTILPSDGKMFIGSTDTTKLPYIDKSMEFLSSRDDLQVPSLDIRRSETTVSVPNIETN